MAIIKSSYERMISCRSGKKGVALFMVLATILIVVVLANVVLNIISSQSRLSRHEVGRIQAYYAAQAGLVYTMEQIRTGTWPSSGGTERYYCFANYAYVNCPGKCIDIPPAPDPCPLAATIPYDAEVTRSGAYKVQIEVCRDTGGGPGLCFSAPPAGTIRLNAKVDYAYQP